MESWRPETSCSLSRKLCFVTTTYIICVLHVFVVISNDGHCTCTFDELLTLFSFHIHIRFKEFILKGTAKLAEEILYEV